MTPNLIIALLCIYRGSDEKLSKQDLDALKSWGLIEDVLVDGRFATSAKGDEYIKKLRSIHP